ncbi:MAG: hypothetical protein F6K35_44960, partial [Okeania sp. SIO2H7]|nr:hypothetical protein [Okeania sp. SIO2H7]
GATTSATPSTPYKASYDDEAPVINASYANYRPADSAPDTEDGEEDNSGYQNFY